jgi:peptidoglycan/xylan/chitin deacetylase (PgdA/CDA1 family)
MNSGFFYNGRKLTYLTTDATVATIKSTSVGRSIFKGVSNSSISTGQSSSSAIQASKSNNKVVILSFDDNRKGDFIYAKPILDKYGFKATL